MWVEEVQFDLVYRWLDFERVRRQVLDSTQIQIVRYRCMQVREDMVGSPSNVKADHADIHIGQSRD